MVKKQRRRSAPYKFRIALETLEGSKTIGQLSSEHEVHPNMIRAWKRQLLEGGPSVFIVNTDQGAQVTADAFTACLLAANIQVSMDGRGRALDNVFCERLWRSVKYENIFLNQYDTVR